MGWSGPFQTGMLLPIICVDSPKNIMGCIDERDQCIYRNFGW